MHHGSRYGLRFCSEFELQQRCCGQLHIMPEIVRVEDRFHFLRTRGAF
jgi:hypothetical protein